MIQMKFLVLCPTGVQRLGGKSRSPLPNGSRLRFHDSRHTHTQIHTPAVTMSAVTLSPTHPDTGSIWSSPHPTVPPSPSSGQVLERLGAASTVTLRSAQEAAPGVPLSPSSFLILLWSGNCPYSLSVCVLLCYFKTPALCENLMEKTARARGWGRGD